jgi:predicted HD phosphohydrolase
LDAPHAGVAEGYVHGFSLLQQNDIMSRPGECRTSNTDRNGRIAMPFTSLRTAKAEDWERILDQERSRPYGRHVSGLLMMLLREQAADNSFGVPINCYQHCLQTATRVCNAGESQELIVCSLFHDAAEKIAPLSHGAVIADILGPFISARNEWMLRHHPEFQQFYFAERPGIDRHAREAFRGLPHFSYAADYCETYDQISFDPDFPILPLEHFEPIVESYFGRFNTLDSLRIEL